LQRHFAQIAVSGGAELMRRIGRETAQSFERVFQAG
jgi:hypothetical protein